MAIKARDLVRYHPVINGPDDGKTYEVRSVGEINSGYRVAWLAGKSGCVSLKALTLVSSPEQHRDEHGTNS